jgi:DNA helicase-2/ATP-dependent DNA helicase PcrA
MSDVLSEAHVYKGTTYAPVDHHVVWDAELTAAAAQVVASILEWPQGVIHVGLTDTLKAIARYYDLKNTDRPSKSARDDAASYRTAAKDIEDGRTPRTQAAKQLVEAFNAGIELNGDTVADWRQARDIIAGVPKLKEVFTNARYVKVLRARDEIGGRLAREWAESGTYGRAADIVRRALDARQVISSQTDPGGVLLMTIHKSKGKEFDAVILVEGQYAGKFFNDQREPEPFEASRRVLRVGITRARHKVAILRPVGATPLTNPRP